MPSSRQQTLARIEETRLVAVIRRPDVSQVPDLVRALAEGGTRAVEITMTMPGAVDALAAASAARPDGVALGAGSVADPATALTAIRAGASFVVSPVFRPSILEACRAEGVAVIPGCYTPTEILDAWDGGADIVKMFPATSLGPDFLRDVHRRLPQVKLMPAGGVAGEDAPAWIAAGATAVAVGSWLIDPEAPGPLDTAVVTSRARQIVERLAPRS